ncbi:MAG TPA: DnaJ domain-containing protein [Myxococcales bacterium]|nr:DnaJ domain-containing protein [Myxococcales bacterium]
MTTLDAAYALLGLSMGASQAEVRRAFRTLSLLLHPDRAGESSTARFQAISAAYAKLKTAAPVKAAPAKAAAGKAAQAKAAPAAKTPRAPARRLSRFSGHLKSVMATGAVKYREDGALELRLRPAEAREGGSALLSLKTFIACRKCAGESCERCGGRGRELELISFFLSIPPGATDGTVLRPSIAPLKLLKPVEFVVRVA